MKIIGFHSGHDSSYGILKDGIPLIHNELERFNRRKNSVEDSLKLFNQHYQKENIIIDPLSIIPVEDASSCVHECPVATTQNILGWPFGVTIIVH